MRSVIPTCTRVWDGGLLCRRANPDSLTSNSQVSKPVGDHPVATFVGMQPVGAEALFAEADLGVGDAVFVGGGGDVVVHLPQVAFGDPACLRRVPEARGADDGFVGGQAQDLRGDLVPVLVQPPYGRVQATLVLRPTAGFGIVV